MPEPNQNTKEQTLQEKVENEILNKPTPPKQSKTKGPLKTLRTYQGDIEEILGKTNSSITSVVMAEQKREKEKTEQQKNIQTPPPEEKEEEKKDESDQILSSLPQQSPTDTFVYNTQPEEAKISERKNKFFFYFGIFLLILGVISVSFVYYIKSKNVVVSVTEDKTIISYSQEKSLNVASSTREELINSILADKQNFTSPVNSILYIKTGDINKFVTLLAPHMPSELVRALGPKYMLGIYAGNTSQPFIILTETAFDLGYSGMLSWEKNMVSDFGQIFSISNLDHNATFEDEALKNKDLRIIKDQNRNTVLLYVFLDKNTILITSNEDTFSALLGKYITSQISR